MSKGSGDSLSLVPTQTQFSCSADDLCQDIYWSDFHFVLASEKRSLTLSAPKIGQVLFG